MQPTVKLLKRSYHNQHTCHYVSIVEVLITQIPLVPSSKLKLASMHVYRIKTIKVSTPNNCNFLEIIKSNASSTITDPVMHMKQTRNTKRGKHDLHMASITYLETLHADLIPYLQQSFNLTTQSTNTKEGTLDFDLSRALNEGTHATFDDPHELALYTTYRLAARTRHLYTILLSDLDVCNQARNLLLPTITDNTAKSTATRVCAIGGGPGFEHVALCSVAAFMASIQGVTGASLTPPPIHTSLYDLYADHWRTSMNVLNDGLKQMNNVVLHPNTKVDTKAMDLRCNGKEQDLGNEMIDFDLFLMCYVLHENAAHILNTNEQDEKKTINGFVKDILTEAKRGAILLCCDASNRLWPMLTDLAIDCGWKVEVKPEKRVNSGAPKSCWFGVRE